MNESNETKQTFHTQGGGIVEYDELNERYIFVKNPPRGFEIGDFMPENWGIA